MEGDETVKSQVQKKANFDIVLLDPLKHNVSKIFIPVLFIAAKIY